MKLYELTSEYDRILSLVEECDPINQPMLGEELDHQLGEIDAQIELKCAGIAKVLASLGAQAEACAVESKRLAAKARRFEANAEHLRNYVQNQLASRGILKLKADTFSISLVACPERVVVTDAELIPPEYVRTKTTSEPDKAAILAAYKQHGECVPGTNIERGQRLQIK